MNRRGFLVGVSAFPLGAVTPKEKLPTGGDILQSFDARDWAKAFVAHVKQIPTIPLDEGTMTTWFANALMRGFDESNKLSKADAGKTTSHEELVSTIRGAVARGWCHSNNKHKEMDLDLAEAITQELLSLRG